MWSGVKGWLFLQKYRNTSLATFHRRAPFDRLGLHGNQIIKYIFIVCCRLLVLNLRIYPPCAAIYPSDVQVTTPRDTDLDSVLGVQPIPHFRLHPFETVLSLPQIERQSKTLDKKAARMQAELRDEAKEGLERDVLEGREALGLVPAGEGEEGQEEEVVPPQVLKERIESVIEVLSKFQVRPLPVLLVCKRVGPQSISLCRVARCCGLSEAFLGILELQQSV